jgi:hypothetical protein
VIFKRVSKAYKQQKELTVFLDKHRLELERIRNLSESVRNEKALKGAKVSEPLTRLKQLEVELCGWLTKVDPRDRKSLRRFADQLLHGEGDRKKLDGIMKDLDRVKNDLTLVMNMHSARMSYNIRQAVVIKSNETVRVNQKSEKNGSTAGGANVTAPTQARTKSKDINRIPKAWQIQIQLTERSAQQSDSEEDDTSTEGSEPDESAPTIPRGPKVRRVKHNKAGRGSTMVNAPLGEKDLWEDVQIVEIEHNECAEGAQMYNYRNNKSAMALAREERRAQIAERREQMLWEKENGVGLYAVAALRAEVSSPRNGM